MKRNSARKTTVLILSVLALLALSCQTLGIGVPTATSVLAPIPTSENTAVPTLTATDAVEEATQESTPEPVIPATPSGPTPTASPTPTEVPLSMQEQKQVFEDLWNVINSEYLYADFNGLDWKAVYTEYMQRIEGGLETPEFYYAMAELVYSLGDEHSAFLTPQQVAAEEAEYSDGHDYVGIGVWLQFQPELDEAVILLVFPGGPAEAAGIQPRDVIVSIEGQDLTDDYGAAIDLLLGVEGTPVTFMIKSPGEEPYQMTLNRGRISGAFPVPYHVFITPEGKRIGYLLLPNFSDSTIAQQVEEALIEMSAGYVMDGYIIDNRLNSGGYDNIMKNTLSYFASGKVGYFTNREGSETMSVPRRNIGGSADLPLVVLVGDGTASFGEIFSGILKDQGRATLIGETTDGNVEVLWGYSFDDGSRVWLAHDTFKPANNEDADWEHDGIVVDIEALGYWGDYTIEEDPAIVAALEYFDQ